MAAQFFFPNLALTRMESPQLLITESQHIGKCLELRRFFCHLQSRQNWWKRRRHSALCGLCVLPTNEKIRLQAGPFNAVCKSQIVIATLPRMRPSSIPVRAVSDRLPRYKYRNFSRFSHSRSGSGQKRVALRPCCPLFGAGFRKPGYVLPDRLRRHADAGVPGSPLDLAHRISQERSDYRNGVRLKPCCASAGTGQPMPDHRPGEAT